MSFEQLGLAALGVYLLALLVVAEYARRQRRDASPGDHFLAGRELGTFVLFLTLYATSYSGNSLLGYPGKAYRSGFSFVMSTGFMMAIPVIFHVLIPKLRPLAVRHRFVTPGDYVRLRFTGAGAEPAGDRAGRWLVLAIGASMSIAMLNYLLAQLKAMGHVAEIVTGGTIPYELGVIGLAGMILFYETRGGMRAVAWTDTAQGLLMLFGLAALLAWLLDDAGGLSAITRSVAEVRPAAVAVPDARTCANWFSTIALLGVGSVVYPQMIQRLYAARSSGDLRRAVALMSFMPLATTAVVTLIGVAAIGRLDLGSGVATDEVLPRVLGEWAAAGAIERVGAVTVFLGALAAIMSTADSCLLSLGSLVARDLLGGEAEDPATTRRGKLIAAGCLLALIPFALLRELTLWRLIEMKMELLIQCAPAFLLAIHWQWLTARGVLWGFGVGTGLAMSATLTGNAQIYGVHAGVAALVVNILVAVAASRLPSAASD